jgi:glucose-1-phosphate thymidylyltransferase
MGLQFTYIVQPSPDGLAQAYLLARDFLDGAPSAMVLGDNIFFGHGLPEILAAATRQRLRARCSATRSPIPSAMAWWISDPRARRARSSKSPKVPPSPFAVTGLYFLDGSAPERAAEVKPSPRGELEITSLLESYLHDGSLDVQKMGRGFAWLDTGTHASLLDAANFVRTLTERQGMQSGSPEEIAYAQGWINDDQLQDRISLFTKNAYGDYLKSLL